MAKATRDQTFWKVLNAALDLDFKKGHLKWTMSELSRKSGITRSLVYYHFGRSKLAILQEAVKVIGEQVIGTEPQRIEIWQSGHWKEEVMRTRALMEASPSLLNFYLLHRARPTEIGDALRKLESDYFKKLSVLFPELPEEALNALYTLFFGVSFAPVATEEGVDYAIRSIKLLTSRTEMPDLTQASVPTHRSEM